MSEAMTFTGTGITYYQLACVKAGIKACKIGMRVNRAYTPGNLRAMVQRLSGKKFKARDYDGQIAAVEKLMQDILDAKPKEATVEPEAR